MMKGKTKGNPEIVSFEDELLIVVDEQDNPVDYKTKAECHDGEAILHRAFSLFIFNSEHELLLQKRSKDKRLWPLYWSNSCCSHPRKGESMELATQRRLEQELGLRTSLTYLYKFTYFAPFGEKGSERELCWVYIGKSDEQVQVNPTEIAEWQYVSIPELNAALESHPENYTPWFKMEWERLQQDFINEIKSM